MPSPVPVPDLQLPRLVQASSLQSIYVSVERRAQGEPFAMRLRHTQRATAMQQYGSTCDLTIVAW